MHRHAHVQKSPLASIENVTSSNEVEFYAEDVRVTIVPKFKHKKLHFICGDFGPFKPQTPLSVPLWLAIALKKRHRCSIQQPNWLTVESLTAILREEKDGLSKNDLSGLPFHYMEVASLLFNNASDDIHEVDKIRTLLEDVEYLRAGKIRSGMHEVADKYKSDEIPPGVFIHNISGMEVNFIRPMFTTALDEFYELHKLDLGLMPSPTGQTQAQALAGRQMQGQPSALQQHRAARAAAGSAGAGGGSSGAVPMQQTSAAVAIAARREQIKRRMQDRMRADRQRREERRRSEASQARATGDEDGDGHGLKDASGGAEASEEEALSSSAAAVADDNDGGVGTEDEVASASGDTLSQVVRALGGGSEASSQMQSQQQLELSVAGASENDEASGNGVEGGEEGSSRKKLRRHR